MRENVFHVSLKVWVMPLNSFSKSTHLPANSVISLLLQLKIRAVHCVYAHIFVVHFFIEGHLDHFHFLATVNREAMNIAHEESEP